MSQNPFEQANAYDRLEALVSRGVSPEDPDVGDLAGELEVVQCLLRDSERPIATFEDEKFRRELMAKLRKRNHWPGLIALAGLAAAVILTLVITRTPSLPRPGSRDLLVAEGQAAKAIEHLTRDDMIAFLNTTEHLLISIRDHDEACSEEGTDMALERQAAQQLLVQQKRFVSQLNEERYNQARHLFASLESILVDVKNLDSCTDPVDVEIINEHISNKRILGKLRLIAQEIQMS